MTCPIESTHIDSQAGVFEVTLADTTAVMFLVGPWDMSYCLRAEEFLASHPILSGAGPVQPSDAHLWNPIEHAWQKKPIPLAEVKAQRWAEVKAARVAAECAGLLWDGDVFDSNPTSRQRLMADATVALIDPGHIVDWVLKNNKIRRMNAKEIQAVAVAMAARISEIMRESQAAREAINAAKSAKAVLAVKFGSAD